MGILRHTYDWFFPYFPATRPLSLLELGNQHLRINRQQAPADFPERFVDDTAGMSAKIPAKKWFEEALGTSHASVDWNGRDGALKLDMTVRQDFPITAFDVGTDFGMSEHVEDLWQCLENFYRHIKPGGLIFHANPEPGSWPGHGIWRYPAGYYTELAERNGHELLSLTRFQIPNSTPSRWGWETRAILRRSDLEFPCREAWNSMTARPVRA